MRLAPALFVLAALAPVSALADQCDDLWYARNAIYKEAGYCFQTIRARQVFGNEGCSYPVMGDVPLSGRQRATIADIVRRERYLGCPR